MTTAPSLIYSDVIKRSFPIATIRISARFATSLRSFVRECATVTVPFSRSKRAAIGLPTILLRPMITHSFPSIEILDLFKSWMIPAGVQDKNPFSPIQSLPTLTGWNPSTSLSGEIVRMILSSSIWSGTGSCTRIPFTLSSAFNSSTNLISSSSEVSSGSSYDLDSTPI